MKGGDRKFAEDCKVLRGEYQHSLLVAVLRKAFTKENRAFIEFLQKN